METTTPKSLAEIKRHRKPIPNVNAIHRTKLSRMDKLAMWITEHIGTMGFFFIIFLWTVLWLGWNTLAPSGWRYDPFPAFAFWLFISNMIQIFLMPLIMIGQNLQSAHAEIRAEADFEVNTKAEFEIETILQHLEYQNKIMLEILEQIQKKNAGKG